MKISDEKINESQTCEVLYTQQTINRHETLNSIPTSKELLPIQSLLFAVGNDNSTELSE